MDEFVLLDYIGDKIVESANKLILEKEGRYEAITERAVMEYVPVIDAEIEMMESAEYFREAEEGILARFFAWLKKLVDAILGRNNVKDIELSDNTKIKLNSDIKKKMGILESAFSKFAKVADNSLFTYVLGGTLGVMAGNNMGQFAGEKIGKKRGYLMGVRDGKEMGKRRGYTSGQLDGKLEGLEKGIKEGEKRGYTRGQIDGFSEGRKREAEKNKSINKDKKQAGFLQGTEYQRNIDSLNDVLIKAEETLKDINKDTKKDSEYTVRMLKTYIRSIDSMVSKLNETVEKNMKNDVALKEISSFKSTVSELCKAANEMKRELYLAISAEAKRQGVATGDGSSKETPAERAVPEKEEKKTGKEIAKDILKETAEYRDLVVNINSANSMIEKRYNDALSIVGECKSKVTSPKQFDQKYKKAKDLSQKFLAQADKVVRNFKKYVDLKDNEIKNTKKQAFMSNAEACKKEISRINDILSIYNSVTSDLLRFAKEIRNGYYTNMEEGKISRLQEYLDNANEYNKIK